MFYILSEKTLFVMLQKINSASWTPAKESDAHKEQTWKQTETDSFLEYTKGRERFFL